VLLLDEPAAGCNPRETEEIDEIIQGISRIRRRRRPRSSHDMRLVMKKISSHIVVLNFGRKLIEGNAERVKNDPSVLEAYLGQKRERVRAVAVDR